MKKFLNKTTGKIRYAPETPVEKVLLSVAPLLPTAGTIAGGMIGGSAAGPFGAIPAAGLGSQVGVGLEKLIKGQKETPEELRNAVVNGAAAEAGGRAVSAVGSKIMGPVISKIKGITPGAITQSLDDTMTALGDKISTILKTANDKMVAKEELQPIFKALDQLKKQYNVMKSVDPEARAAVDAVGEQIKKVRYITQAFGTKEAIGHDIYGQAGKEVMKRGNVAITEKAAQQTAAGGLKTMLQEKIPALTEPMAQYAEGSQIARSMNMPLKNWWMMGLGGMAAQMAGLPTAPASLAAGIASVPYFNLMAKRIAGKGLQAAGRGVVEPAIYNILDRIQQQYTGGYTQPYTSPTQDYAP